MALSFRAYLKRVPATYTPVGDFAAYARTDARLADAQSWPEVRDYLKAARAGRSAIKTALDVWKAYEVARDEAPPERGSGTPHKDEVPNRVVPKLSKGPRPPD